MDDTIRENLSETADFENSLMTSSELDSLSESQDLSDVKNNGSTVVEDGLLSESITDFLAVPQTKTVLPVIEVSATEKNVCVVVDLASNPASEVKALIKAIAGLCRTGHSVTETHCIAVLFLVKGPNKLSKYGYCDDLTAYNILFRICSSYNLTFKLYKDFETQSQREITIKDLSKRPFKF